MSQAIRPRVGKEFEGESYRHVNVVLMCSVVISLYCLLGGTRLRLQIKSLAQSSRGQVVLFGGYPVQPYLTD